MDGWMDGWMDTHTRRLCTPPPPPPPSQNKKPTTPTPNPNNRTASAWRTGSPWPTCTAFPRSGTSLRSTRRGRRTPRRRLVSGVGVVYIYVDMYVYGWCGRRLVGGWMGGGGVFIIKHVYVCTHVHTRTRDGGRLVVGWTRVPPPTPPNHLYIKHTTQLQQSHNPNTSAVRPRGGRRAGLPPPTPGVCRA